MYYQQCRQVYLFPMLLPQHEIGPSCSYIQHSFSAATKSEVQDNSSAVAAAAAANRSAVYDALLLDDALPIPLAR